MGVSLEQLKNLSHFSSLSDETVEFICKNAQIKDYKAGATVFEKESPFVGVYTILTGSVMELKLTERKEVIPFAILKAGDFFGQQAFLTSENHQFKAQTLDKSEFLFFSPKLFEELLSKDVAFSKLVLTSQAKDSINLQNRLESSVSKGLLLQRSLHTLQALININEVNHKEGFVGLIDRIIAFASVVMNADRASLFIYEKETDELWSMVAQGEEDTQLRFSANRGIAGWVIKHDEIINIENAYEDVRFNKSIDAMTGYKTESILCAPVKNIKNEIIAVIQVINKKDGKFDGIDETIFKSFAHQVSIALENYKLYDALKRSYKRVNSLLEASTNLSSDLDIEKLIINTVHQISEIMDVERSSLFLWDQEKKELWSKVAQGMGTQEIRFPDDQGIAGAVIRSGEAEVVEDAYADARFNREFDKVSNFKTRNMLCMPVKNRDGKLIGVTQSINLNDYQFDKEKKAILQAFNSQLAVLLENAQLYTNTEKMRNFLEHVHQNITTAILVVDEKMNILSVNHRAVELIGKEAIELQGANLEIIITKEESSFYELLKQVKREQKVCRFFDKSIMINQKEHSINFTASLFERFEENEGDGYLLSIEDISNERRYHQTLSRYMDKSLIDKVLSDPNLEGLGGVDTDATILFSDVRDFTGISSELEPSQTLEVLNTMFTELTDIINGEGGLLDKYIGDALMAVFGVPYPGESDAVTAVKTARRMKEALPMINRKIKLKGRFVRMGIGIASGRVTAGNLGSRKRMDYTVIGEAVNIASILEQMNKLFKTSILVDEATYQLTKHHFHYRHIDQATLKGYKKLFNVYEYICDKGEEIPMHIMPFNHAHQLFMQKNYHNAVKEFELIKNDPVSELYVNRCHQILNTKTSNGNLKPHLPITHPSKY